MGKREKERRRKDLVVGLDFGTTHTGISYSFTGNSTPRNIDQWPRSDGSTVMAQKTPTHIVYEASETSRLWGSQAESHANLYAWMKYHLDKDSPPSQYDDPQLVEAMESGLFSLQGTKSPEDITTDYLSEVFKFAMKRLKEAYGEGILDVTSIKWWLAKPAIWGAGEMRLQEIVEKAAKNFGGARENDSFNFITEPEAAVFSAGYEFDKQFKKGSTILVCDCGGGTVDAAVFKTVSLSPLIEFEEVVRGQGGKCGSGYVDRFFQEFMEKRFGDAYKNVERKHKMTGSDFMKAFETNKQKFGAKEGEELVSMTLPMAAIPGSVTDKQYNSRDGQVILTLEDMIDIFAPIVQNIIKMITEQEVASKRKGAKVTDLLLVGGLGRSPYLQTRIKEWCGSNSRNIRLKVFQSKNSWGAVSHGALLRGLNKVKFEKRITRFHFGIPCMLAFKPRIDPESDLYISHFTGQQLAKNCVSWLIHANTLVTKDTVKSESLYRELKSGKMEFSESIVYCKEKEAPRKKTAAVQSLCQLKVRLSKDDIKRFETMQLANGGCIVKFRYKLVQTKGEAEGSLVFKAQTVDGDVIGKQQINLPLLQSRNLQ